MKQKLLEQLSGVTQSTISKILNRTQENNGDVYTPSEEVLRKLFQAMGLKLADIVTESDHTANEILGYLATPLTGVSPEEDAEIRRIVEEICAVASEEQFSSPPFQIYWPDDHTHPSLHADIPARQVYVTDRSRASTHDFIVIFCATPSYGVGQENEIATQACVPAIRLVPDKLSRMMGGSFIRATDITYAGSLESGITIDTEKRICLAS